MTELGRHAATAAPGPSRRRLTAAAMAALFVVGVVLNAGLLRRAGGALTELSPAALAVLGAVAVLYRLLQTALLASSLQRISWRRALLASEAYAGCSNSLVGGGAVGTGVKTAMLRSWGVENSAIATSITVTAIVPAVAMWLMALLHTAPEVAAGTASTNQVVLAGASVVALAGHGAFWWLLLQRHGLARRLAGGANAVARRARPLCRGPLRRLQRPLARFDAQDLAERMRADARALARGRAARLVAVGLASQVCLALLLTVTLWGLGAHQAGWFEVFQAFAVARVAASFVPLPGGIGVLDVGLFTGLVHVGAPAPMVMAALVVYRASTFALPIATGSTALLWWRRVHRRRTGAPHRVRELRPAAPAEQPVAARRAVA
ncbi:MAG: YbhN family protein [Acidimicrobiia bacterium]